MDFFSQQEEDADYEFNARYDYIREAYGPTAEGLADHDDDRYDAPQIRGHLGDWQFRICACNFEGAELPIPF